MNGEIIGEMPMYVNSLPVTALNYTFYGNTEITKTPIIPSSVLYIYQAFKNCTKLTTITNIPNSVTSLTAAFHGCTSLTGTIEINSNPTNYTECFFGTTLPITLTGSSTMLEDLANTANNGNVSVP